MCVEVPLPGNRPAPCFLQLQDLGVIGSVCCKERNRLKGEKDIPQKGEDEKWKNYGSALRSAYGGAK